MWTARRQQDARRLHRVNIDQGDAPVSFSEVLLRWQDDADFRTFFVALLAEAPYSAFRWETPPVTAATVSRPFEFVLLDSPGLITQSDPHAFAEHFGPGSTVVAFPNLGGDAILVVPKPRAPPSAYGHLAAFSRMAPKAQQHALWTLVGKLMAQRVGLAPVWLSTAGGGVSWLHVRLDDRPKYYGYGPYRAPPR